MDVQESRSEKKRKHTKSKKARKPKPNQSSDNSQSDSDDELMQRATKAKKPASSIPAVSCVVCAFICVGGKD